jgi:homoserine kinase type II
MAVYTEVFPEELAEFLVGYDLGELVACKGIAEGVENSNFVVETTRGQFILTLYEKRTAREDLPYFLNLMEHLAKHGVRCPVPVRDREGRTLRELSGRPAALVSFLAGYSFRRPKVEHCGQLGRALAGMHLASATFPMSRTNALSFDGWVSLYAEIMKSYGERVDELAPGLSVEIERELEFLKSAWPSGLPTSVIHADLFPDNVFFLDGKLSGLIDFYFACNDAQAYDLAICLNAWCFEPDHAFNVTKGRALLREYRAARPLEAREVELLPLLARGAALRFLLTRLYDWYNTDSNALVKPKNPLEYRRKLKFHQTARSASDYGL